MIEMATQTIGIKTVSKRPQQGLVSDEIKDNERTGYGLMAWMDRLNLPVTGNRRIDIETKRQYDIDTGKARGLKNVK